MEIGTTALAPNVRGRVTVSGTIAPALNVREEGVHGLGPMPVPFEVYAWLQV